MMQNTTMTERPACSTSDRLADAVPVADWFVAYTPSLAITNRLNADSKNSCLDAIISANDHHE